MAQAYVPIQTVTVGSGGATSIDFTNVPQNYTDLVIYVSARSNRASTDGDNLTISFNGSSANFSYRLLYGAGSGGVGSANGSNNTNPYASAANQTANTFGNVMAYIPNYTSSNYKSISVDGVSETNATTAFMGLNASLWSNTAAITSISLGVYNGTGFLQNTTATLYGIGGARASGGTITADARYTYHTFTSTGTFTALEKIKGAEVLVIAGGGGGGYNIGGGGGAGGLLYSGGVLLTAGSSYSVVVGSGGSGAASSVRGSSGNNSLFSALNCNGGGGGGTRTGSNTLAPLSGGGSGGGGSGETGNQAGAAGTSGQGNAGGTGKESASSTFRFAAGGGGGAGAVGVDGDPTTNAVAGAGGIGSSTYSAWGYATSTGELSGGVYYYAGGGGGGAGYNNTQTSVSGAGGLGGGGRGGSRSQSLAGVAGTANTGGGGGGGDNSFDSTGKNGGSGLVIIRYPN